MAEAGAIVGRFEIVRELGRGGMAVVYLARQTELDREVALKELASFQGDDTSGAERFVRESRVSGSLAHRNIVTVFDFFRHEGTPYIAMEYLARGSLRPLVGRLSPAQAAGVLEGVLAGLSHAERRRIVHRDLKPENLLVTDDGEIKIADFGIAKALNQLWTMGTLTPGGMALGTPVYMAPEQAMAKEIGPWTDLYSTGVIAYELLVGQPPFSGGDTPMAILFKHVHDPIPPPREVNPELDPGLAAWVEGMLAKDPGERPANAQEAADSLDEIATRLLGPRWRREARLVEEPRAAAPVPPPEVETPDEATPTTDAFRTYRPKPPESAPPPAPPEPEAPLPAPAPPPPAPPAEEAAPPEARAPAPAPVESFEFPAAARGGRRRLPWLVLAAIVALAALAGVLVLVLTGGGGRHKTHRVVGGSAPVTSFTRARVNPGIFGGPGDQEMQAVATDGSTLVGVGYGLATAKGVQEEAWRFADGQWRPELQAPLTFGPATMNAAISVPGGVIAVGNQLLAGRWQFGVAWRLVGGQAKLLCLDGRCALRAPPTTEVAYGVARSPTKGLVAVGRDTRFGHFVATAWWSRDGRSWQEVLRSLVAIRGKDQVMKSVVATPSGFVAVGRFGLDAAVWTSPDGTHWTRVESSAFGGRRAQEMDAVARGRSGLVAVGTDRSTGETQGAAWVSRDGTSWARIREAALVDRPGTALTGIAAVPGGFVAGGFRGAASAEKDAAAWSTKDGRRWRRLSSAGFGGPGAQEIDTLTYSPRFGVVAVGDTTSVSGDLDAAVWFGKLR
jgi:serine/threonine protein kinase